MEALYQKYRPNSFNELIGQKEIAKTLSNAVALNKISHSYLFYGPRGSGKTSTARILAKVLNCHSRKGIDPCNLCVSCQEISSSSSVDVMEMDAASHTQVQNIRDVIIDSVRLSPARDRYRIYILDEVHMLSTAAFNALLKTLEEPPHHAVFILATTEINKVPLTIISRCQSFRFRAVGEDEIMKRLEEICRLEGIRYEELALRLIVRNCSGAVRDALSLLEKVSSFCAGYVSELKTREILGYPARHIVKALAEAVISRDVKMINSVFKDIKKEGYDILGVLREMRDVFSKSFLAANELYTGDDILIHNGTNPFLFAKLARKINRIIDEVKYSDNPFLLAEIFIYTLIDTVDIESIIKTLESSNTLEGSQDEKKDDSQATKNILLPKTENITSDSWK
ncbi:MAG: DNA polymerase III subunit gamma/tau, partial [Elusimicrobiales bacterium]